MPVSDESTSSRLSWLPWRRRSRRPLEDSDESKSRSDGKSTPDWRSILATFLLSTVIGTILFGLWQSHTQNQSNQQLAKDQQRATILQTYIDNMRDLLINQKLTMSPTDEVRQVARAQTISTLRTLDADRNRIVLQFLQKTHLISAPNVVIGLSNANLSNADLSGADLSGADLSNATLTGAHLNGANLSNATMYGADLNNADLSNANLSNAILSEAFLSNSMINHATLTGGHLNGAILTGAKLNDAFLSGADLNGANVSSADLSGTDLSDADLRGPSLSQAQLDAVYSCTNAILSTGLKCGPSGPNPGSVAFRLTGSPPTAHSVGVTLTYWYTESPTEAPVISKLINQFEKIYPNININAVYKPFFQTRTDFVAAVQNGNAPDVLRSDVGWIDQFASQDYLLDIDPYIDPESLSDYKQGPTGSMPLNYDYYKKHLYGLPQVTDFLALLYNKAELASPPATMCKFKTDAMKVVQANSGTYGFETNGAGYNVLPFLLAFGGGILDHNKPLVNDPESVNGLQFLLDLQRTGKVMPTNADLINGRVDMVKDFMSGKTAMIFDGPYDISQILTGSSFKNNRNNLGIVAIPSGPGGQTGRSPLGGQSYVISASTAHPYEAYKFISFMSSKERQIEIAQANHTLPTLGSAYNDKRVSNDPFIQEFRPLGSTAVARQPSTYAGNLFDALDPNIANALNGIQSPRAALNGVADAWNQLIAGS